MFRELDSTHILDTLRTLIARIEQRFPGSGLAGVARELLAIGTEATVRASSLSRPNFLLRIGVGLLILAMIVMTVAPFVFFDFTAGFDDVSEFVQFVEAGLNDIVLLGVGIFFLMTIETRLKRRIALRDLRALRSIAHIVDMHQLTKDPEQLMSGTETDGTMDARLRLAKYLDYCSELLSLSSKIAALYVQHFDDSPVLDAVNEIEGLTSGLSRKIWQKIMILDTVSVRVED